MRRVIGVAGAPGAGKSTLVAELARQLPDACALHMDDYENMTHLPIEAVARWYREGADIDAFQFPRLQAELQRRKGEAGAGGLLLFETQFGRAHRATGQCLDLLIWIDTPLDVALARSLRAALERGANPQWLRTYLEQYLGTVRELLEMQRTRVAPGADCVLDGRGSPVAMATAARDEILRRLP